MKTTQAMRAGWALFIALIAWPAAASAAEQVSVRVQPRTVEVGETFRYEIEAEATGNNQIRVTRRPDFPSSMRILGTSNSPRFVLRNGRAERSLRTVYRVRAEKKGKFEIGPPSVQIGTKSHQGKTLSVKVVERGSAPGSSRRSSASERRDEKLFVDYVMRPQHESYVGEQITLAYYLYTATMGVSSSPQPPDEPSLDDFWIEDLSQKVAGRRETVEVDGRFMHRTGLRAYALFPLQAGTTTINPLSVKVRVGGFFSNKSVEDVESDAIDIEILPLPPDAPDSFYDGNVGSWEFRATTDRMTASVGEPVRIRVAAEGAGQVSRIQLPPLPDIEGARVAGSDEKVDISVQQMTVRGSKTMEYTLVPTEQGDIEIPALEFSYFDPDVEKYRTQRSEPLTIIVKPGGKDLESQPAPTPEDDDSAGEESVLETIIGNMQPPTNAIEEREEQTELVEHPMYWIALVLPLLGLFGLAVEPLVRRWKRRETPTRTRKKAVAKAKSLVGDAMDGSADDALDAIYHGLEAYVVDALSLKRTQLSQDELPDALAELGASAKTCAEAGDLLAEINTHRFAPGVSLDSADIEMLAERAESLIHALEKGRSRGDISAAAAVLLAAAIALGGMTAPTSASAQAQPAESRGALDEIRELQQEGRWTDAAGRWATLAAEHPGSAEVQYNLGTALAHAGDYGRARLALERAALYAPDRNDIGQNREAVERIVRLRQIEETRGTVRENTTSEGLFWWRLAGQTPQNTFPLAVALFLWVSAVFGVLGRIRDHDGADWEKWAAIASFGIACLFAVGIAGRAAVLESVDPAVVVADEPNLREGPSKHAANQRVSTVLVPGVMLPVVDTRDGWVQLEFADGTRAWLERSAVDYVEAQDL